MSNKVAYVKMTRYFKLFSASITQHCDVYSHTAATKRQPSPSSEESDLKLFNFVLFNFVYLRAERVNGEIMFIIKSSFDSIFPLIKKILQIETTAMGTCYV